MNKSIVRKITFRLFIRQLLSYIWLNIMIAAVLCVIFVAFFGRLTYSGGSQYVGYLYDYVGSANVTYWHYGVVTIYMPTGIYSYSAHFFAALFIPIGAVELISLINAAVKNNRMTRTLLDPLAELARTANTLNESAAAESHGADVEALHLLAGQLGAIDAGRLDRRIDEMGAQRELRELARAINGMLDRINSAYRAQAQFVSDASHELRTPISVIQGYANLLDRWGKDDERALQESITAIKNEAANMKDMVEQLLFLARGDAEAIRLHPELFDLAELAVEVVNETAMISDTREFKLNNERAIVRADRALIKQAVRVLTDNAVKYTDPNGQISISTISANGQSKLVVSDTGIGIAPEALPHIFERFARADTSRARATGGAGLGLAIARWIVTRHNGVIEAVSREGIGSRMTISLREAYADYEIAGQLIEDG